VKGLMLMGLVILRIVQRLILPPANVLILLLLGFLAIRARRTLGRLLIAAGFLLLYGLSISPVSSALIEPLERDFRPVNVKLVKADGIVVLGGGARDRSWIGLEPEAGEDSLQRLVAAVKLYRALQVPIMITGGAGDPSQPQLSDADAMARAAAELGVPQKDIILDNRSPTTLESARTVKRQFNGKRILLVTSAHHLKRAMAMFNAQGLDVIPEPSGYRRVQQNKWSYAALPGMDYLGTSSAALSERISYFWYRVKGDI
jgi:uncharacterized SAM-binding protein YcdF (DUF218 family)